MKLLDGFNFSGIHLFISIEFELALVAKKQLHG